MPFFVQLYKSTDLNAPTLTGQTNSLITLLNRVLVEGYTPASVTSITRSGAVATVTLAVADATLITGNWVTISGAVETDYNGIFQITVNSSTEFTYTVAGTPTSPATGTILYAKAPLQWEKPFVSTNAAVYRSADTSSNRDFVQITDNATQTGGAKEAQIWAFETMTAFNTGFRRFPSTTSYANGMSIRKSVTADATARAWTLIGDGKTFYFIAATGDTSPFHMFSFGHFVPYRSNEGYNTFVNGEGAFNSGTSGNNMCCYYGFSTVYSTIYAPRNYYGLASTAQLLVNMTIPYAQQSIVTFGTVAATASPNGPDSGLFVVPLYVFEHNAGGFRGRYPGMYIPFTGITGAVQYDTLTDVGGLSGKTLVILSISNVSGTVGAVLFDMFGPWD